MTLTRQGAFSFVDAIFASWCVILAYTRNPDVFVSAVRQAFFFCLHVGKNDQFFSSWGVYFVLFQAPCLQKFIGFRVTLLDPTVMLASSCIWSASSRIVACPCVHVRVVGVPFFVRATRLISLRALLVAFLPPIVAGGFRGWAAWRRNSKGIGSHVEK